MSPDDWGRGMANEAASVDDPIWARETRLASWRFRRRPFAADLVLCLVGFFVAGMLQWAVWLGHASCTVEWTLPASLACPFGSGDRGVSIAYTAAWIGVCAVLGFLRVRRLPSVLLSAASPLFLALGAVVLTVLDWSALFPYLAYQNYDLFDGALAFGWGAAVEGALNMLLGLLVGGLVRSRWERRTAR